MHLMRLLRLLLKTKTAALTSYYMSESDSRLARLRSCQSVPTAVYLVSAVCKNLLSTSWIRQNKADFHNNIKKITHLSLVKRETLQRSVRHSMTWWDGVSFCSESAKSRKLGWSLDTLHIEMQASAFMLSHLVINQVIHFAYFLTGDIIFNAQYPELPPDFIFGEDAEFLPEPSELPVSIYTCVTIITCKTLLLLFFCIAKCGLLCSENIIYFITLFHEKTNVPHALFLFFSTCQSQIFSFIRHMVLLCGPKCQTDTSICCSQLHWSQQPEEVKAGSCKSKLATVGVQIAGNVAIICSCFIMP